MILGVEAEKVLVVYNYISTIIVCYTIVTGLLL